MKTLEDIMTDGTFFRESNGRFYLTDGSEKDVTAKFLLFMAELSALIKEEVNDALWDERAEQDLTS